MENFIPKTKEELVNQMKGDNFKGDYYIQDNFIIWNISDKISLKILLYNQPDIAFITYSCNIDNKTLYVTEDEPLMEETTEELEPELLLLLPLLLPVLLLVLLLLTD